MAVLSRLKVLASLNTKLALLVVTPVLVITILAIGAQRYIGDVGDQAIADLKATHTESLALSAATRSLRNHVANYARLMKLFIDSHQDALISSNDAAKGHVLIALSAKASGLADIVTRELEPVRQSFANSIEREEGSDGALASLEKRYVYVVRLAKTVPRVLDLLIDSNERTEVFLKASLFDRARAQFIFEERERLNTLQSTVKRLSNGIDDLAIAVENHIAKTNSAVIARADRAAAEAMTITVRGAAAALIAIALIAVAIIKLAVSRPIADLTSRMLRLARGDLDIDIVNQRRRDEIGDMAGALQVFKEHAFERKKIEQDLAEHRDDLEQLVLARTEQIEQQKVEIEKALEEAQSATRLKSEFLASMSHEIRTPMNGIIGMTELMLECELDDQLEGYASTVLSSSEALLGLINDVLDFSKIEAGKLELEAAPLDLLTLVKDVADLLGPGACEKAIDLKVHHEPGTPRFLIGDSTRIRQVLINLVGNALKFTDAGQVVISAALDRSSAHGADGPWLTIAVEDTGIGIAPDKQTLIFDRFTQADGSTTRKYGGTGLGLAISAELVGLMGAKLQVESEVGKGSRFYFTIAMAEAPAQAPAGGVSLDDACSTRPPGKSHLPERPVSERPAKPEGRPADQRRPAADDGSARPPPAEGMFSGLRVLLVEDNRINRQLAQKLLSNLACEVKTAEDGQEAVARVGEGAFDIILMDCQMPVMDGFEATRVIKAKIANNEIAETPIVALTANAMKGDRERCLEAGMDDYFTKPVRKKDLIDILTYWCLARENQTAGYGASTTEVDANDVLQGVPALAPMTAGSPPTPSAVIDQSCLDEMRELMGDQFKAMLGIYLEDAVNYLDQIDAGLDTKDAKTIATAAHPLKSSSQEMGIVELSGIAKKIEENARLADKGEHNLAGIGPLVGQLHSSFDKARSELEKFLVHAV
ncbi:MAG: ATP-binding protein [Alphaproteobacteria bacterium]|nr:ATP-binding protein [Alphaproteobacteria bacterium]